MFKTARDITCPVALRNEEAALRVRWCFGCELLGLCAEVRDVCTQ